MGRRWPTSLARAPVVAPMSSFRSGVPLGGAPWGGEYGGGNRARSRLVRRRTQCAATGYGVAPQKTVGLNRLLVTAPSISGRGRPVRLGCRQRVHSRDRERKELM